MVEDNELMTGYRRFGQRLEGHPTPVLPWVDVATGSLGQGLPDAVGIALAGKFLERLSYRVWVLCGDSEVAEGSIWEALDKASYYSLSSLVAMIDVNRLGQRGPTELEWNLAAYAARAEAFGAQVIEVDGHDLVAIDDALGAAAAGEGKPTVILARTIKGRGFSEVEDKLDWHGKPLSARHGGARDRRARRRAKHRAPRPAPERRARRERAREDCGMGRAALRHRRGRCHAQGLRGRARRAGSIGRATSSHSTARWATPPTPRSSPAHIRTGTSRCS